MRKVLVNILRLLKKKFKTIDVLINCIAKDYSQILKIIFLLKIQILKC